MGLQKKDSSPLWSRKSPSNQPRWGTLPTQLFSSLHMRAFLDCYGLTPAGVALAHSFYWVWNTANDVFGGYLCQRLLPLCGGSLARLLVGLSIGWSGPALKFL